MENDQDSTKKIGQTFVWLAWVIAIALLVFVFQGALDKQWNPNAQPELRLTNDGLAEVVLKQNKHGHYVTDGTINDVGVTFLLDTGATDVSIPARVADKLDLVSQGNHKVQTANGTITVYQTTLSQLSIGNIYLYDVRANINPSMQGDEILLGMSALKRVEFSQTGKQLILREQK